MPTRPMSLISCWAQWWRHEQTETLNLRGRFEKRRLPTKCVDSSSTIGRESKNSSAVAPASGQPDHVAPDVAAGLGAREADAVERVEDLGQVLDAQPVQLQALARRHVSGRATEAHGEIADRAQLLRGDRAVRDAHAQHEVAVLLGPLRVHAPPLREREVVGRERVEAAVTGCSEQVVQDVEPVLALLDPLDLGSQVACLSTGHSRAPSCRLIHPPAAPVATVRDWHRGAERLVAEVSQGRDPPPLVMNRPTTSGCGLPMSCSSVPSGADSSQNAEGVRVFPGGFGEGGLRLSGASQASPENEHHLEPAGTSLDRSGSYRPVISPDGLDPRRSYRPVDLAGDRAWVIPRCGSYQPVDLAGDRAWTRGARINLSIRRGQSLDPRGSYQPVDLAGDRAWTRGARINLSISPGTEPGLAALVSTCRSRRGQSQACQEHPHGFAESRHSNWLVMPVPDKSSDGSKTSGPPTRTRRALSRRPALFQNPKFSFRRVLSRVRRR